MMERCLQKIEKDTADPDTNNKNIQPGYKNGIWYRKMYHAHDENWKRETVEGIELPIQEIIRTFGEKENYKNLRI